MKRFFSLFLILFALISVLPVADAQVGIVVSPEWDWMPDANLRTEVREQLGIAEGQSLTQERMLELTYLHAPNAGVSDLTGLEHATNLNKMTIYGSNITDLTPLSGLTNLAHLTMGRNQITDISPLASLTSLTHLGLHANQITDISPLTSLVNLTWLRIRENPIEDFTPLLALPNLTDLDVALPYLIPDASLRAAVRTALDLAADARITVAGLQGLTELSAARSRPRILDLSGLEYATNLTLLDLYDNHISDLAPLAGLVNLTWLNLSVNRIDSRAQLGLANILRPLSGLTNLTTLKLEINFIGGGLGYLSGLTNLTTLELADNWIEDISALSALTNLTRLTLSGHRNSITDRRPLLALPNLTDLDVALPYLIPDANLRAEIRDQLGIPEGERLTPARMLELTYLHAPNAGVSDLTGLEHAVNLNKMTIYGSHITDLTPLSGLTNLAHLTMGRNQISDISPLASLTSLTHLGLHANQITDISPLASLVNLTWLRLRENSIEDFTPLSELRDLTDVDVELPTLVPDAGLAAAVRTALGLAANSRIIVADLQSLTRLDALEHQISDLTGLELATNLTELHLTDNLISDLTDESPSKG